jgi:5'-methylthioadenosine phosphorylase
MRHLAIDACKDAGIVVHPTGTVVVIQGPRFSSKSESKWFGAQGWEVINMTAYPEAHLAKELEMCAVNVSLITDYDSGLHGNVDPVSHSEVVKVFSQNLDKLQKMLAKLIETAPSQRDKSQCATTLEHARII